jgi:hypothetical protein
VNPSQGPVPDALAQLPVPVKVAWNEYDPAVSPVVENESEVTVAGFANGPAFVSDEALPGQPLNADPEQEVPA